MGAVITPNRAGANKFRQGSLDIAPTTAQSRCDFIMRKVRFRSSCALSGLCLLLSFSSFGLDLADTNAPAGATTNKPEASAGSDQALRAYLQLQEQIHEAQLAIERNRQESEEAAVKTAKTVADRLQSIEQSLAEQRANELEAARRANETLQHANRTVLMVVSALAALGCMAILFTAYFQWRAVNRFTAASAIFPMGNGLGPLRAVAALEAGENSLATLGPAEQAGVRLLGAIERLEKRIQELERTSRPSLDDRPVGNNILDLQSADAAAATPADSGSPEKISETSSLLDKGQSLLNLAKLDEALACFDEVLARDPGNTEALVKKGAVLERLRKPQEALVCYDRAIATDSSMTIAYLYKGGLYNRMERFSEALKCYEQALHTQEKRRAS
jgi:tetratricopeptide (TPR) repeat protein